MDYSYATAVLGLGLAFNCCIGFQIYLDYKGTSSYKEEKVLSKPELEKVVQEEARKLRVDLSTVHFSLEPLLKSVSTFDGKQEPLGMVWKEKGFYQLYLKRDKATRTLVRHELYHIARGHLDRKNIPMVMRAILSTFVNETQAEAYALLGIKL